VTYKEQARELVGTWKDGNLLRPGMPTTALEAAIADAIRAAVEARDAEWVAAVEGMTDMVYKQGTVFGAPLALVDWDATRAAIIALVQGGGR
jgi:hypothetical protein